MPRLPQLSEYRPIRSHWQACTAFSAAGCVPTNNPQPPSNPGTPAKPLPAQDQITQSEQRKKDTRIIKFLLANIWPPNDWGMRGRVILGFGLSISGKLLNVQVPLLFKNTIYTTLNIPVAADSAVWVVADSPLTPNFEIADGAVRIGAMLFGELLNATFASVDQRAIRKVARETFEHILNLDLKLHLTRHTGGLTRAINQGTKGITFILQAIVFRIIPTAFETPLACGILFLWDFAAIAT
ncbi:hypothetical protein NLI96_g12833 [Meripilus lineatus]|uniref:ABC transmembrane type-1 domain-containing protein n=1 Tax=Meripilus lineatus TaxID=2056292 RepID=A0AAD5UQH0_9APHY|nr:hypothetical protein NLI96_g12833 [Physisporinus lineatus]